MPSKWYAVKRGRKVGLFDSWKKCKKQVWGYKGAMYKSFLLKADAKKYLNDKPITVNELEDDRYYVYTDGAFNRRTYKCSWAIAVYHKGKLIATDCGRCDPRHQSTRLSRNVTGEVYAAAYGIQWGIKNNKTVVICHDYIGVSEWAKGYWKANIWLTKHYVEFAKPYVDKGLVFFKKVQGHHGIEGNELVDKLAKETLGYD